MRTRRSAAASGARPSRAASRSARASGDIVMASPVREPRARRRGARGAAASRRC
jgi:hypothetical protein